MSNKSDKPLVRNTIIFCVIAILVFHFAWSNQLFHNYHNLLFAFGDLLLLILFGVYSAQAYKQADDPNKDWKRVVMVGFAVALCVWAGAWAAGYNERVNL